MRVSGSLRACGEFLRIDRLRFAVPALPFALGILAHACASGTTQPLTTRTFDLQSVNGLALPAQEDGVSGLLVAGSLTMIGTDSAEFRQTTRGAGTGSAPAVVAEQLGFFSVHSAGSFLVLEPHTLGMPPDTAVVSSNQLVLKYRSSVLSSAALETRIYVAP